ncbi:MAG TPA: aromatic acid/H+ symport family MFS transporter, partial [Vicinamibacterales bacterium]|nr:aromatic acid/H+ symport family MFS transporter [Vicinamibacterales bacterium]
MKPAIPLDIPSIADDQPVRAFQVGVAALCGLIAFLDGFDAQVMGYLASALTADLHIARPLLGPVISSGLVGMAVGALVCGSLADRFGRKPVLVASAVIFGLASLATSTADSIGALSAWRIVTGIGLGGALPNAIALTAEYMPDRLRSTAVTGMMCGFSFGAAIGGVIAAALIPSFGWRSVFVVGGAFPLVIAAVAAVWLPESRSFAAARQEAVARFPVVDLLSTRYALGTIVIWVVYFTSLLDLYFLSNWLPTIVNDAGVGSQTAILVTTLFQFGGIAGALVLGRLLDRYRTFYVLTVCYVLAAVFIVLTGQAGHAVPLLALTVFCAGIGVIGGQNAAHALSSAFYPTSLRATGVGWALGIGRIGSIVGPTVGGYLLVRGGIH